MYDSVTVFRFYIRSVSRISDFDFVAVSLVATYYRIVAYGFYVRAFA